MKRWTTVFRVLANINRLKIIEMLHDKNEMNVGDISNTLKISFNATSNHLSILKNVEILDAHGTSGHVLYSINKKLPKDFRTAISLFLK